MIVSAARPVEDPLAKSLSSTPQRAASVKSGPTIMEMFGVPGAGKTTLVAALGRDENQTTRTELTAAWRRLSLWQQNAFLFRALVDVRCLGSAVRFAFRTRLTSRNSIVRLARLIAKAPWMRSRRGQLLLDESFLQEIWSICFSARRDVPNHAALVRFIRCLYDGLGAHIVFVDTADGAASQRISGRRHGHSRLDGLATAQVESQLAATARLPHAIIAAATAAGLPVQRLDGSDPVDANAARLRILLWAHPEGRSAAPCKP